MNIDLLFQLAKVKDPALVCVRLSNKFESKVKVPSEILHIRADVVPSDAHRIKILASRSDQVLGYLSSRLTSGTIEEAEEFHVPQDQPKMERFEMHLVKQISIP